MNACSFFSADTGLLGVIVVDNTKNKSEETVAQRTTTDCHAVLCIIHPNKCDSGVGSREYLWHWRTMIRLVAIKENL